MNSIANYRQGSDSDSETSSNMNFAISLKLQVQTLLFSPVLIVDQMANGGKLPYRLIKVRLYVNRCH